LLGVLLPATASIVFFLAIILVSFLVGFLVTLASNLTLIENGCSDAAIMLNTILNMIAFVATSLVKTAGQAIAVGISAWIYTSILPSTSKACRAFGG
jgi:hypothetical protein